MDPIADYETRLAALQERRSRRRANRRRSTVDQIRLEQQLADMAASEDYIAKEQEEGGILSSLGSGVMNLLKNSPLQGAVETAGGLASYAAEGLGSALDFVTGKDETETANFEDSGWVSKALNLNPLGLMANFMGVLTSDSNLRTRGRQFFERAGSELETGTRELPVMREAYQALGNIPGVQLGRDAWRIAGEQLGQNPREWRAKKFQMGLELASDPLNAVDLGVVVPTKFIGKFYNKLKTDGGVFQKFAEKHPKLALLPERWWKRLNGQSKQASVLGDERAEAMYAAQQAFENEVGLGVAKIQQDVLAREAAIFSKLTPDEAGKVKDLLPKVVEPKKPDAFAGVGEREYRALLAGMETSDETIRKALVDTAELYGDMRMADIALRSEIGLQAAKFEGPYEYLGRQFSEELDAWFAANPRAMEALTGAKMKYSKAASETALETFEKTRKLRDFDFAEAEKVVRDTLRATHGLPDNVPIWSRDFIGDMARRMDRVKDKATSRHLYVAFGDAFAQPGAIPQENLAKLAEDLADANSAKAWANAEAAQLRLGESVAAKGDAPKGAVKRAVGRDVVAQQKAYQQAMESAAKRDPSTWTADTKAKFVESTAAQHGFQVPPGATTLLEVARKSKMALPDDFDELAKMATSVVSQEDAKWFRKYADDFYAKGGDGTGALAAIGDMMDRVKGVYQRAQLAIPKSVFQDIKGSVLQAGMASTHYPKLPSKMLDAAKDLGGNPYKWSKGAGTGYIAPDDVLQLQAEGVLNTMVGETLLREADASKTAIGRAFQTVEKQGVIGGALSNIGKVAEKAGAGKIGLGLKKAGEKVGKATDAVLNTRNWMEQVQRLSLYRAARDKGLSHAEASEEVFKYFGKFGEMTKLTRQTVNRFIFFWSWWSRSLPISVRMLLDHPVKSRMMLSLMAGSTADDQSMPEWQRRMGGWAMGTDQSGNVSTINLGGGSYFGPTFSVLQSDMMTAFRQGDFEQGAVEAARNVARSAPPYLTMIPERIQERDYFTNRDWYANPKEKTGSQAQAPMGFYWFYDKDKPTAIQKMLDLKAKTDENGNIRYMTMNPKLSWLFGGVPGAETVMQDLSSFIDPRESGGPFSPAKGMLRQVGVPAYSIPTEPDRVRQVRTLREALRQDADKLTGGALTTQYGRIAPDKRSPRGRDLADLIDVETAKGKSLGLRGVNLKRYLELQLTRKFQQEWRLLEMDRRLRVYEEAGQ